MVDKPQPWYVGMAPMIGAAVVCLIAYLTHAQHFPGIVGPVPAQIDWPEGSVITTLDGLNCEARLWGSTGADFAGIPIFRQVGGKLEPADGVLLLRIR